MARPSWDEYFINMTKAVAERSTCDRGRSGAIIVKDKRILCTGYVGSPPGMPHCDDAGHDMRKIINDDGSVSEHCVRTIHAEQNTLAQAAKFGISVEGATLYCKMTPCRVCSKMIVGAGIKKVVAEKDYHSSSESKELFEKAGVELVIMNPEVEKYDNM
jgi:dCMP deaminase